MLRTKSFLAIAYSIASLASVTSVAASPHAITTVGPVETEFGHLPLPPRVPRVLPQYCATHNRLEPSRPGPAPRGPIPR